MDSGFSIRKGRRLPSRRTCPFDRSHSGTRKRRPRGADFCSFVPSGEAAGSVLVGRDAENHPLVPRSRPGGPSFGRPCSRASGRAGQDARMNRGDNPLHGPWRPTTPTRFPVRRSGRADERHRVAHRRLSPEPAQNGGTAVRSCGVRISLGAISAVEARVSDAVEPAVAEACAQVAKAAVKHADGTSWLQTGALLSLRTIATAVATVFKIVANGRAERSSRSTERCAGSGAPSSLRHLAAPGPGEPSAPPRSAVRTGATGGI